MASHANLTYNGSLAGQGADIGRLTRMGAPWRSSREYASHAPAECQLAETPVALTQRERDVLALLDRGRSYAQIAVRLGVKRSTVVSYTRRLQAKLGIGDKQGFVGLLARLKCSPSDRG